MQLSEFLENVYAYMRQEYKTKHNTTPQVLIHGYDSDGNRTLLEYNVNWNSPDEKNEIIKAVARIVVAEGATIVRVAIVAEAWMVKYDNDIPLDAKSPSEDANRIEIVIMAGHDFEKQESDIKIARIVRDGEMPKLEDEDFDAQMKEMTLMEKFCQAYLEAKAKRK